MKIGNLNVERLTRLCGVDVPLPLQDRPNASLEYVAGYLHGSERKDLSKEIIAIQDKYHCCGPPDHSFFFNNPHTKNYLLGYIVGHPKASFVLLGGSEFKKGSGERELDLVEIVTRLHRNPSFIPYWAWDARDDEGDHEYHFGR